MENNGFGPNGFEGGFLDGKGSLKAEQDNKNDLGWGLRGDQAGLTGGGSGFLEEANGFGDGDGHLSENGALDGDGAPKSQVPGESVDRDNATFPLLKIVAKATPKNEGNFVPTGQCRNSM